MRCAFLAIVLLCCVSLGCEKQTGDAAPAPIPRAEFEALVFDKTQEEVLKAVGKPNRMTESVAAVRGFTRIAPMTRRSNDPICLRSSRSIEGRAGFSTSIIEQGIPP